MIGHHREAIMIEKSLVMLYKMNGISDEWDYEKRGSVFFRSKPEGHQEYNCFEKGI
ncbi:hypothetical protein J43TS3_21490 [Ornithinibacillus bavariensis]|uniref:Uncharacterized protein n=1 Tax=Ornithinibacillus bavariensis TaxID=545502 RepID=A0A920C7C8_9BACI|nr:hypothetical protein J43TS3_21490 [Ornithinibacillus bavariensis]